MSCYHPIPAFRTPDGVVFNELSRHDIIGNIDIACGQCLGCRLRRVRDWSIRIMHEASSHDASSFVTLTYGRDQLPPDGSLCYRDYQLFMKRLRRSCGAVRFFMCGEYGPVNMRPHYHACLFGVDFRADRISAGRSEANQMYYNSPMLEKLWGHGIVSVQDLTQQSAAYCAGYIVDKVTGDAAEKHYSYVDDDGVIRRRVPEFSRCSLRPGIGAKWFSKFGSDCFPLDRAVASGTEYAVPKYYDKLLKRSDPSSVYLDRLEYERTLRARAGREDNTPRRLLDREEVHKARIRNQKRESVDV